MIEERQFTPEQVARDELLDKGFYYSMLPVREFARMMKVAPQLIYYRVLGRSSSTRVRNAEEKDWCL